MPTVTEDLDLPGGTDPASAAVTVEPWGAGVPVTAFNQTTGKTISGQRKVDVGAGSAWTVMLDGNAALIPAGTVYRCLRSWPGSDRMLEDFITVPASGGPYRVDQILDDEPAALESSALAVHKASVAEVHWRHEVLADWEQWVMSTDAGAGITDTDLIVVDGMAWIYGVGGSATTTNRRDWYLIPGTSGWNDSEMLALWWGGPIETGSGLPQHGNIHRAQVDGTGKHRGAIVWHDAAFGIPSIQNFGVWAANLDGSGGTQVGATVDANARTVTAGSRTSSLSTLTVGANHRLEVGQLVQVSVADGTYNGAFPIEAVASTTISYRQALGDDPASGAGVVSPFNIGFGGGTNQLLRDIAVTAAARTNNTVTATVAADHPFVIGDRVTVDLADATYDGTFRVHAVTDTTVSWVQVAADDVSGGTGSVSKVFAYLLRSRLVGNVLEAAWKPYQGLDEAYAVLMGDAAFGDPRQSAAYDLSAITPPTGAGSCAIAAGHIGSAVDAAGNPTRRCQYGPIVARRLD